MEEYLEIIDKEVDRCTRIVDGLLDFSRPKGKAKGRVALNALVDETLFLLKHHQRFKRLESGPRARHRRCPPPAATPSS